MLIFDESNYIAKGLSMYKITTQEIGEKTVYKTSDGKIFDCEKDALTHEKWTVLKKKMNKIKSIK